KLRVLLRSRLALQAPLLPDVVVRRPAHSRRHVRLRQQGRATALGRRLHLVCPGEGHRAQQQRQKPEPTQTAFHKSTSGTSYPGYCTTKSCQRLPQGKAMGPNTPAPLDWSQADPLTRHNLWVETLFSGFNGIYLGLAIFAAPVVAVKGLNAGPLELTLLVSAFP